VTIGSVVVLRTPASAPTYLDCAIGWLAPSSALRRQRAVLRFEATRADPDRVRYIDGRPWTRSDGPPSARMRLAISCSCFAPKSTPEYFDQNSEQLVSSSAATRSEHPVEDAGAGRR